MKKQIIISMVIGTVLLFGIAALAELPNPGMKVIPDRTALVLTDPQNDFLSPKGVTWGVVGKSVTENNTVENIEKLLKTAKTNGIPVFVSPHYYYPTDSGWKFGGALEVLMHNIGMFNRKGPLDLVGFEGSGADWLDRYKTYIEDGKTVVASPHKVYTEAHMRELLERGFEVAVVKDATAAAILPEGDGYAAALVNFRYMANAVWTTEEAVKAMSYRISAR
jgi:nicotinamidase-related amidase